MLVLVFSLTTWFPMTLNYLGGHLSCLKSLLIQKRAVCNFYTVPGTSLPKENAVTCTLHSI